MRALKASSVLMWSVAAGFGIPAPLVALHVTRERTLPSFFGLFDMYGGPWSEASSPEVFAVLLGSFALLAAVEAYTARLLWDRKKIGALLTLALLPIEAMFWAGFAVPFPPLIALARLALLWSGRSALR